MSQGGVSRPLWRQWGGGTKPPPLSGLATDNLSQVRNVFLCCKERPLFARVYRSYCRNSRKVGLGENVQQADSRSVERDAFERFVVENLGVREDTADTGGGRGRVALLGCRLHCGVLQLERL